MKVVILAGGFGTRLSEETDVRPKPMVEIAGKPILWHIMKIYSSYGYNDFIICCGYKAYFIKEYFANYYNHMCDLTVDLQKGNITIHKSNAEPWKVTLIDTGLETMTGGRIKRIKDYIGDEEFLLTYGDGVSDINIKELVDYHHTHTGKITVSSIQPIGRFGALNILEDGRVDRFVEKPAGDGLWINGGFFVCDPEIFDYIEGDHTVFEKEPLEELAKSNNLFAYKHIGFWKPMDTLRDKKELESLWESGVAPWKIW